MERPLFGEITAIAIDQIDIADRLRPVDPAHVEAIAASIAQIGLENPISVRPDGNRYRLVAGAHRLAAMQALGWINADAVIKNVNDVEARLVEIDENLMRRELSALDRALSLAERRDLFERVFPEAKALGRKAKKSSQTLRQFGERFTKQAAKRTGLSERSIQMSLEMVSGLAPEARELLRLSPLADNQAQLLALSRMEPEQQIAAAKAIAQGEAKSPKQARLVLGYDVLTEVDPQEKLFTQFLAIWARMEAPARKRVQDHLARTGKKTGKAGDA